MPDEALYNVILFCQDVTQYYTSLCPTDLQNEHGLSNIQNNIRNIFHIFHFVTCSQLIHHSLITLIIFVEQRKFEVSVYAVFYIFLTVMSDLAWWRLWYFVKGHKLEASSCADLPISLTVLLLLVPFRTFAGIKTIWLFATHSTNWCPKYLHSVCYRNTF